MDEMKKEKMVVIDRSYTQRRSRHERVLGITKEEGYWTWAWR